MNVINAHKRIINQPLAKVSDLIKGLATEEDRIWPYETWPAIKFRDGLKVGSKGGHGLIRYTITKYDPSQLIQFKFSQPKGFDGTHEFRIREVSPNKTEMHHIINMSTSGVATWQWVLFIRWLHDALIEDAFDKVENCFSDENKQTKWSLWVTFWRWILARKTKKYPKNVTQLK